MKYFLAFLFLINPAHGQTTIPKTSPACDTVPVTVVEETVWVFVPVPINIFKALATKCTMPGRIRWNGGCWKPERIPRS